LAPTFGELTMITTNFIMYSKKTTTSDILVPLDPNQGEEALLREARSQKRKAVSPVP
jgi:hypothetical protein